MRSLSNGALGATRSLRAGLNDISARMAQWKRETDWAWADSENQAQYRVFWDIRDSVRERVAGCIHDSTQLGADA